MGGSRATSLLYEGRVFGSEHLKWERWKKKPQHTKWVAGFVISINTSKILFTDRSRISFGVFVMIPSHGTFWCIYVCVFFLRWKKGGGNGFCLLARRSGTQLSPPFRIWTPRGCRPMVDCAFWLCRFYFFLLLFIYIFCEGLGNSSA